MPHDSIHVDRQQVAWSIRELLAGDCRRSTRSLSVAALWSRFAWSRCWGEELPPPARIITQPGLLPALRVETLFPIQYEDTVEDHVHRIANLVKFIQLGGSIEPLVIGRDGDLWDGMHRLAALYLTRTETVIVLDFSEKLQDFTLPPLQSVFCSEFLSELHTQWLSRWFAQAEPFPHVFCPQILVPKVADEIQQELEFASWRLVETEFYQQYEFSLLDCSYALGPSLTAFRDVVLSGEFVLLLSRLTGHAGLRIVDIACHKSTKGQAIGIHTDYSEDEEICRLTLHFNESWKLEEGGLFVVFGSENPNSAVAAFLPEMNTAILFEISEQSFHAVTCVDGMRPRYSIVIAATSS